MIWMYIIKINLGGAFVKLNLPVILLKGTVLMPYNEIKLEFEDEPSKSIIDESELFHNNKLFVVTIPSLEEEISIKSLPKIVTEW